jgi:hypothetical protein
MTEETLCRPLFMVRVFWNQKLHPFHKQPTSRDSRDVVSPCLKFPARALRVFPDSDIESIDDEWSQFQAPLSCTETDI